MSAERAAVERINSEMIVVSHYGSLAGRPAEAAFMADLRLILTDYARLQSESAKDGEALEEAAGQLETLADVVSTRDRSDADARRWRKEMVIEWARRLRLRLSARKATPPAGSTQIGEG